MRTTPLGSYAGLACLAAMFFSRPALAQRSPTTSGANAAAANGGTWIASPQFDEAKTFSEGLAAVKVGEKWGYIDKAGQVVIAAQFVRWHLL